MSKADHPRALELAQTAVETEGVNEDIALLAQAYLEIRMDYQKLYKSVAEVEVEMGTLIEKARRKER